MTPELSIRTFSNDQYFLDKVFYSNFYQLGNLSVHKDVVVVDIGAHCGYFCFASLALGAKRVYAFEPFVENFRMLLKNMGKNEVGITIPYCLGIYPTRSIHTLHYPVMKKDEKFFDFGAFGQEDEGVDVNVPTTCSFVTLDDLFTQSYVTEHVNILKLNIGYAEIDILKSFTQFEKVDAICLQLATNQLEVINNLTVQMAEKGYTYHTFGWVEGETDQALLHYSRVTLDTYFKIK